MHSVSEKFGMLHVITN